MSKRSLLKYLVAFGLLALALIFLGVNFVPRIFASSSTEGSLVVTGKLTRLDYIDEQYPRAIVQAAAQVRPDYIDEQYPRSIVQAAAQLRPNYIDEQYPRAIMP